MKDILDVLPEIESRIYSGIKTCFLSINKIDRDDNSFKDVCDRSPILKDAIYIINPNSNNSKGSIFLDERGKIILEADFFANLLIYLPLDFDLGLPNIIENHPFKDIINNIELSV